jgi:hypothetical protein
VGSYLHSLVLNEVESYADPWAKRYVAAAFAGDVNAAFSLFAALSNEKRGEVARAMWLAKVPRPAFREYLGGAWDHDHQHVIAAAQSRRRLAAMFRYAEFPVPAEMPSTVRVWRGTSKLKIKEASRGYSWTTERDVACWFAMRYATQNAPPLVLTATVAKADIALVHNERSESEIVLMRPPEPVEIDGTWECWRAGYERHQAAKVRANALLIESSDTGGAHT